MVHRQREYLVAPQLRRAGLVKDRELLPVETDQAIVRGQPQVSSGALRDRVDAVVRKTLRFFPNLVTVVADGLGGVEGGYPGYAQTPDNEYLQRQPYRRSPST